MRRVHPAPPFMVALVPILLVAAVYAPVGGFSFVTLDDPGYVTANDLVLRGLSLDGIGRAFSEFRFANWHPLTWISHMADVSLFGAAPSSAGAHHLVNAAFHAANSALLFIALRAATGAIAAPLLAAALFAVHPMHVESVAWVSERKDVLAGLFGMLTLCAYVRYARCRCAGRYLLVLLAFVSGLMSKATLVTMPFLLLLLDIWPLGRISPIASRDAGRSDGIAPVRRIFPQLRLREVLLEKIPMLALSAMASALTIAAQRAGGAVSDLGDIPISLRLSNIAVSYTRYLAKAVWPAHLAALYPMPKSIPAWEVAGGAIFLLAMTVAVVRFGHRRPWLCIGWLWFLGAMVPMIGIVQVGRQAMADRYAYLPFIGLYIAFSFSVADLVARQPGRHARILIGIAIVALVGGLGLAARAQAAHWKDSRALFERLVESDPGEGWYNLGNLDLLEGKPLAAERSYREAIRADPRHGRARTALAVEMIRSGHVAEAIPLLEEAIRLEPDYVKSWYNLGAAYGRLGDDDAALRVYEQVLEWRPDDTIAMVAAGSLRIRKGDVDSGLAILQRAANLAPEDRELLDTLRDEAILAGREDIARNAGNRLQGIGPPPRR